MGKPQIAVRIPPFLLEKLNNYVERTGTSKTDVVVSAIAFKDLILFCFLSVQGQLTSGQAQPQPIEIKE